MIMKQSKEKFDFKAFGQAIKAARKAKGISRNQLADKLNIAPVSYTHLDVYKRQQYAVAVTFVFYLSC